MNLEQNKVGAAGEKGGFQEYTKKDEAISEEVQIGKTLDDLRKLFYPLRYNPVPNDIDLGGDTITSWVRPFIGHPERKEWLANFIKESKQKMRAAFPAEAELESLTNFQERKTFFEQHQGVRETLIPIAREVQDQLTEKLISFDRLDEVA